MKRGNRKNSGIMTALRGETCIIDHEVIKAQRKGYYKVLTKYDYIVQAYKLEFTRIALVHCH